MASETGHGSESEAGSVTRKLSKGRMSRSLIEGQSDPVGSSYDEGRRGTTQQIPTYMIWQANRELRRDKSSADDALPAQPRPASQLARNLRGMESILLHPFSLLLVTFPLGICSSLLRWGPMWTFWLNFTALIPLAKILGDATEELDACIHNEVISGLLNATFGNAVEMIITVQTLNAGLIEVVKATLLGSVLSNMLLVLGMSFFFGGILEFRGVPLDVSFRDSNTPLLQNSQEGRMHLVAEKEQTFIVNSALVSVTMLLVSCMSFALPSVFAQAFGEEAKVLHLSRIAACIMMASYGAYLIFQLFTHRKMLANAEEGDADEEHEDGLTIGFSIGLLCVTTLLVSISSEFLVEVIEDVVSHSHLSESFIGIVLLPIVGNACEHAAAVRFAVQNKPGLSISIAVGSSTQVALFLVPFSVLMGWAIDQPMTLNFGILNTSVMILSVLVVLTIVVDGRSNWLEGYMLCSAYALIAVMYWHVDRSEGGAAGRLEL